MAEWASPEENAQAVALAVEVGMVEAARRTSRDRRSLNNWAWEAGVTVLRGGLTGERARQAERDRKLREREARRAKRQVELERKGLERGTGADETTSEGAPEA
jgi:hypothetical protein